jgi:hypothetical protein
VPAGWFSSAAARGFVRFYTYLDTLPPRKPRNTTMSDPRPRPLRTAASIIGGITALISGLVGSGLLTGGQGDAITGIITAVLTLLAAFGITVTTEHKITPLADPPTSTAAPHPHQHHPNGGAVRDSKNPEGPVLRVRWSTGGRDQERPPLTPTGRPQGRTIARRSLVIVAGRPNC